MDGELSERKGDENSNKEYQIRVENSREWSTTGVDVGTYTFLVYINDTPEGVNSCMNLFADNTKLPRLVKNNEDFTIL